MTKSELKSKLDAMTWSYTRISALDECPHSFYLTYIEKVEGKDNAFAQWGTMMHSLLEENLKGKLEISQMLDEYEFRYNFDITEPFPYDFKGNYLGDAYYKDGINYLFNYNGLPDGYKIVAVEQKVRTKLGSHPFIGIIDLLLQDSAGNYVIVDHKSKKGFKSRREQHDYARQLYLYARFVHEKYGALPSKLVFNLIRTNEWLEIPFSEKDYDEALDWALKTIESAYEIEYFEPKLALSAERKGLEELYDRPDYFCQNICDHRERCVALNGGF